jgi:hypothetical protein
VVFPPGVKSELNVPWGLLAWREIRAEPSLGSPRLVRTPRRTFPVVAALGVKSVPNLPGALPASRKSVPNVPCGCPAWREIRAERSLGSPRLAEIRAERSLGSPRLAEE